MFDPYSYFKDKSVLLVGNGEVINETNHSNYDCIVRMNLGGIEKPCDVWINNLVYKGHSSLRFIPNVDKILRLNCEKNGTRLKRIPKVLENRDIWYWNVNEFNKMCSKLYERPTTGIISIYFLRFVCNSNVTVTGFDFFSTRNRYTMEIHHVNNLPAYPCHNMSLEKQIITDWANEGKISFK